MESPRWKPGVFSCDDGSMETENSFWYFRGKEARGNGDGRETCRARGLNRRAWLAGWDAEDRMRAEARRNERPAEVAQENEEGREWFARELEKWMAEN